MKTKTIIASAIVISLAIIITTLHAEPNDYTNPPVIKCETPMILEEYISGARKIAQRDDTFDTSVLSLQEHFRVHYDTTLYRAPDLTDSDKNGIPDYIDSTLVYLEYAWDLSVNQLGYRAPKSDNGEGGGDEIDVYIKNYGSGGYGVTYPTNIIGNTSSGYMYIDNNYSESQYASKGYDGLRVTTAHEFFHVVQFGYLLDLHRIIWWMEQSAVWMEERAWDDVNDYLAYLSYFFSDKTSSLDSSAGYYMYGAGIWAIFLSERYGNDIIRDSWAYMSEMKLPNVEIFDEVLPLGLSAAFHEFAVWNYFTKERANTTDFYPDGENFIYSNNIIDMSYMSPPLDSLVTNSLTSRYVELIFVTDWTGDEALNVQLSPRGNALYENSVVFYNSPTDYKIHSLSPEGGIVPLEKPWGKALLITSCSNTEGKDFRFAFAIDSEVNVAKVPQLAFDLHGAFPNPFNPSTTIRFNLPGPGNVSVNVFNVQGQKVVELFDGHCEAGENNILWNPGNTAGGIYFVTVKTPYEMKTSKMLFLK